VQTNQVVINVSNQTGTLYVISTPIGNLDDLSHRAVQIFKHVKYVAAEDTRHSRKLLNHYRLAARLLAHHKFNENKSDRKLIKFLESGDDIALISDAGTPLISDPGYSLVKKCREKGIRVVPVPGPSALVCALSVSGLPTDRFLFEGFLPEKHTQRVKQLHELRHEKRTMVFYEAPHRVMALLADVRDVMGDGRKLVIARELTKKFETIREGTAQELLDWMGQERERQKGEFVVLIHGIPEQELPSHYRAEPVLRLLLEELPLKKAAALTARITGESKNAIYQLGLELRKMADRRK
jgi:16S rRNA (cytidine1402-2'-O)-methyltransferase